MNKNSITALVPVKGNSERVKKKNLRNFGGSTLYEIKLSQLKKTKKFNRIIISSEDKSILEIAKKAGFDTHLRDSYYSTSSVSMSKVYSYIASEIDGEDIAWINVTNPLVEHEVYDNAVEIYHKINTKYDCLLSSVRNYQNFFFKKKPVNFKPSPWPRSQDLKPLVSLSFAINILKRKNMIKWGSCVGNKPFFFFLNPIISTDIDDQNSFKLSELIFLNKKLNIKKKHYIET